MYLTDKVIFFFNFTNQRCKGLQGYAKSTGEKDFYGLMGILWEKYVFGIA